jgi:hypothetical protein
VPNRLWGVCVLASVTAATAVAAPQAQAVPLGAADDYSLLNTYRPGTIESMQSAGVRGVRLVAYEGRSNATALASAAHAASIGMPVQLVLTSGPGTLPSDRFAAWAGDNARRFAPYVRRFSVLNEPDLLLPAADLCDTPAEVSYAITTAGLKPITIRQKFRVKKRRWVYVTKTVRGKRRRVRVREVVTRRTVRWTYRTTTSAQGQRRRVRRRVVVRKPVYLTRYRNVRRVVSTSSTRTGKRQPLAPARACRSINRARLAAGVISQALPEVRRSAPGAEVLLGETSAVDGVLLYIEAFMKSGLRADGWAHHPYPGPWEAALQHAERVNALVGGLPVYWTEFGVQVRGSNMDPVSLRRATELWAEARAKATSLGVRQIVAYGWWATGSTWDSAAEGVLHN